MNHPRLTKIENALAVAEALLDTYDILDSDGRDVTKVRIDSSLKFAGAEIQACVYEGNDYPEVAPLLARHAQARERFEKLKP